VLNIYRKISADPDRYRQLNAGDSLITIFTCGIQNKLEDIWSHYNYIVYVMEGKKIWHTGYGSYDLTKGSCVFVRKGAYIVEHTFEPGFCTIMFFVPDEFIYEVLKSKATPIHKSGRKYEPIIALQNNSTIKTFFHSMVPHFNASREPDQSLVELKFRELILTLADNPANAELLSYFSSLLREPRSISLQRVMEDNFCFNLRLEEFAKLSSRSLSAFKRDFQSIYSTTPGKWLMEKRLNHTMHLLTNLGKTVAESAFESGFMSASHFSRAFRQRFGMSPATIKQQKIV